MDVKKLTQKQEFDSLRIRADDAEKKLSEMSNRFFAMEDRAKELYQKQESLEEELNSYKSQANERAKPTKETQLEHSTCKSGILIEFVMEE